MKHLIVIMALSLVACAKDKTETVWMGEPEQTRDEGRACHFHATEATSEGSTVNTYRCQNSQGECYESFLIDPEGGAPVLIWGSCVEDQF